MKFLDKYGGKPTPPSMKPKSWAGAIISVLIYSVVLAIISLNVAKVYRSYVRGEVAFVQLPHSVIFNAVPDEKGVKDFWDIPPLDFKLKSSIFFYERDNRSSIQRIEVWDNTGYNPHPIISSFDQVPIAKGVTTKVFVPLDSYTSDFSSFPSPQPGVSNTLSSLYGRQIAHRFSESLKALYFEYGIMDGSSGSFFDHEAHLFVRFKREDLNNLKRCQLQIVLANQGQFQALRRLGAFTPTEREYQSRQWFTTLASPSYTFDPTNYRETLRRDGTPLSVSWSPVKTGGGSNSRFRLLHIRSSLNRDQMEAFRKHEAYGPRNLNISSTNTPPINFLDWTFFINYVNNFNFTVQRTTCDGVTDGLNFRLARANRPEITDDTIYVPKRHEGRSQLDSFQRFRVPSQILVTGVLATERMTVYSVNLTSNATHIVLKVNRTDPVVFATDETKNLRDIPQLPATPPESWICSPDNYNQRDGCDCKCGALDPDCLNPTQAVFNCEAGMTCSTEGECSVADANKNIVSISQPCRKLLLPGEFELVGYVGSMNQYIRESRNRCTPCYDVLYNGEPQLDESFASENGGMGQFVCDYAANGFALSRSIVDQELSDSVLHDETKVNGHRWIEVSVGPHPMFPVKTENDTRRAYKVKLSADQGNEEIVDVIQTESPHSKGFQRMQIQGLTKRFRNKHISRGHIISSLSPDSTDLLILPEPFFKMVIGEQGNSNGEVWNSEEEEEEEEANGMNGVEEEEEEMGLHLWEVASNFREMRNQLRSYNPRFLFPLRGPYSVTIDQHQLHILSATNASGVGFQRLTLGNVPDFSLGRKTVMTRDISAKDFTDKAVYIQSQIFTDLQPPYTVALRGTPANDVGRIEILQVVGIEPTQWHCPLEWFGDDVCDCNCGEFDIDCADPSVEAFSQKVDDNFDTVHCNQLNDDPSFNGGGYYDSSSSDSSYYGPSSSDSSYYDSSSDNAKRYCPYNPGQPDHAKCTTTRATGNDTLIGLVLEDRLLFRTPIRLRHTQGDIIETSFPAGTNQFGQDFDFDYNFDYGFDPYGPYGPHDPYNSDFDWNYDGNYGGDYGGNYGGDYDGNYGGDYGDFDDFDDFGDFGDFDDEFLYGDEFYFDDGFDSDMYWDSYDPFANIDPSSLDRAPPIDSVNTTSVLLSPTVQVLRSDNVFLPQDRHRINGIERTKSPDVLELDVAMFIVPTRKAFHEGLNLCPSVVDLSRNRPVMFTQLGWDGWKVKKDWQVKVKNCKLEVFDTKQCVSAAKLPRNSYRRYCADFMPPMNVLHYETDFPINGRWDFDQFKRNPAVVNVPEYTIDMQTSYFFTHDENIGNVDRSFAASMMGAVEVNQGGQLVGSFPGSSLARSTGNGTTTIQDRLLPANPPTLETSVTIEINPRANLEVEGYKVYGTGRRALEEVQKFGILEIPFDMDSVGGATDKQALPLQPGYQYNFLARLEIFPTYKENVFGTLESVNDWTKKVVQSSVSIQKLDYKDRNRAIVRYRITFEDKSKGIIEKIAYSFKDFITDLGAATAIIGIGAALLATWQNSIATKIFKNDKVQDLTSG